MSLDQVVVCCVYQVVPLVFVGYCLAYLLPLVDGRVVIAIGNCVSDLFDCIGDSIDWICDSRTELGAMRPARSWPNSDSVVHEP